ncbi:hypothetical protein [Vibrio parahaemolyticus]|uniref:hypothetical protein n=1 Tax=Vibrio parahaemolyticus TaxID=670 RepID=UPI003B66B512
MRASHLNKALANRAKIISSNFKMKNVESFNLKDHVLASPGIRCIGQMIDGFISLSIFVFVLSVGLESGIEKELVRVTAVSMAVVYYLFSDSFPNGQSVGKNFWALKS